jgi:hypothetical protein
MEQLSYPHPRFLRSILRLELLSIIGIVSASFGR